MKLDPIETFKECAKSKYDTEVNEEGLKQLGYYCKQELNETEQGIFDWGLDFLEMQKKSLEATIKDLSNSHWMNKLEKAHIEMQIQLLDKFIDLIKNKTVLTPWENDPKAQ